MARSVHFRAVLLEPVLGEKIAVGDVRIEFLRDPRERADQSSCLQELNVVAEFIVQFTERDDQHRRELVVRAADRELGGFKRNGEEGCHRAAVRDLRKADDFLTMICSSSSVIMN